ncbi:transcription repressor NadR [Clostridium sp. MSJ-4]|uniref:Transcription repressor NadR n=1 Tax=Clostridium simiarum TaxID=2841506 RepID=A0ABS6F4J0_9CLOT|nr:MULTISPECIES: transcription repressor NadR [Clostridium]MBU5593398.1 transcription repressor NadR [Clostridium simiarum]
MGSKERRESIEKLLIESNVPQKGIDLANNFNVTRQVIVRDIAILRAQGLNIIATPEGYIIPNMYVNQVRKLIALAHSRAEIESELKSIVKFGGIIEDVIVEHPLYGEIKAMLMIKTYDDISNFINKFKQSNAEPLSSLTGGVHIHTVSAENNEVMEKILHELRIKGFLVSD